MGKRMNITISDSMDSKLNEYAERYGVAKSMIISFIVGQWIDEMERMNNTVFGSAGNDGFLVDMVKKMANKE